MSTPPPPLPPTPEQPQRPRRPAPESDGGWEVADLVASSLLATAPGSAPVPISVWRAHGPHDPARSSPFPFAGLTPRLAAMLVATYTHRGDLIVDFTDDLAVQGVAGAGGRLYRSLNPTSPTAQRSHLAGTASLVLLRWPPTTPNKHNPPPSPTGTLEARPTAEQYPDVSGSSTLDAAHLLSICRELLKAPAHTVAILAPPPLPGAYHEHASLIIPAAARAGLGYLQHLVIVTTPIDEPGTATISMAGDDRRSIRTHLDLLVFVLRTAP